MVKSAQKFFGVEKISHSEMGFTVSITFANIEKAEQFVTFLKDSRVAHSDEMTAIMMDG